MSARKETADRLHAVAVRLLRRAWARDEEMGVSRSRASALSVLAFGGARTLGELAEAEHVTAASMSRLVGALEADGYVTRTADPADARAVRIAITRSGRAVVEHGRRLRVDAVDTLLSGLSARDLDVVRRAVTLLETVLQKRG